MAMSSSARVRKRRAALRRDGLRPVQIWVPDTRGRRFASEGRRQSKLATEADRQDMELLHFMDASLDDISPGTT